MSDWVDPWLTPWTSPFGQHADGATPEQDPSSSTPNKPYIEYWMWRDGVLVPATKTDLEWIHMLEREREALWRLKEWQRLQRRSARWQTARSRVHGVCGGIATRCRRVVAPTFHRVVRALVESSAYGMRVGSIREQPWISWHEGE